MAHNDTRRNRTESADPAHLRANAASWRALANTVVVSALAAALIVSVFALLEAASNPASNVARSPASPESQGWRAGALQPVLYSNLCARREPLSCLADSNR